MWKRNKKDNPTIQDQFPKKTIQLSLEKLPWEFAENQKGRAWEVIKASEIESISSVLAMVINSMKKNQVYGEYTYYFLSNRVERTSKKIKPKTKFFEKFKLSSPVKIRIFKIFC